MTRFGPEIDRVLSRTHPSRWPLIALRWDTEAASITLHSRGELAAWLRANDLGHLANEAERRKVPPGCVLALLVRSAEVSFHVFGKDRKP